MVIILYNSSFQNCENLCSCPVFCSEFSKKTGSIVTFQLSYIFDQNHILLWKKPLWRKCRWKFINCCTLSA